MKKNLIALAALAAVGAASAQSTVSITGLVGAAYQSVDSTSLKPSYPQYVPGVPAAYRGFTLTDATIKVGVVEDLGSGLKAQASIALDSNGTTSTANFAQPLLRRDTSISLSSTTLGAVSFQSTRPTSLLAKGMVAPAYLSDNIYDTTGVTDRQAADVVQYMTPTFSGFSGYVQWVDVANTSVLGSDGKTSYGLDGYATPLVNIGVIGANYAIGSFTGGVAYKAYRGLLPGAIRNNKLEAFVTYDFGVAKIGGGYDGAKPGTTGSLLAAPAPGVTYGGAADSTENSVTSSAAYSLGVSIPFGAFTVGANYAKRDINTVQEYVVKYELSKRTNFNASVGKHSFDADTTAGSTSGIDGRQYRIGVYHAF